MKNSRERRNKNMFHISRQAAHKEIKKMNELELIKSKGTGRTIYYIAK